MSVARLQGWVPFRIYWRGNEPAAECCYMGTNGFPDPFFTATMHFELQTPFNSLFRQHAGFDDLAEWASESPGIAPSGFIFHSSRCGSTLITRLLAALPENLVLSEPEPLEGILNPMPGAPAASLEQRAEWLRVLVSALGQRRSGREQRLFIKFDPGHIFALPLLRTAFPQVPWIFAYREPVEVLVSNLLRPAAFLTPGMFRTPLPGVETVASEEAYAARVLGAIFEKAAREFPDPHGIAVNYRELPAAIWGRIARHFGLQVTPAEISVLSSGAAFDAKRPQQTFQDDTQTKRREATDAVRELARTWLEPSYQALERLRP